MALRHIFSTALFLLLLSASAGAQAPTRVDSIRARILDRSDKTVLVAAHRGDWRNATENSAEGIISAAERGADIAEVDVRKTLDGKLILMHNATLSATTDKWGLVRLKKYSSIKKASLKNGCRNTTRSRVPSLEEALLAAKGRIMLNLDKAFPYLDEIVETARRTGTLDHIIIKSGRSSSHVLKKLGPLKDSIIFMPIISLNNARNLSKLKDYVDSFDPLLVELCFREENTKYAKMVADTLGERYRLWYNPITSKLSGGHDDELSLTDPQAGYGFLLDSLAAGVLQTDRPADCLEYLEKRGRR